MAADNKKKHHVLSDETLMSDTDENSFPMDEMSNEVRADQNEAFQSSEIEKEEDVEDEDKSQESFPIPIERSRKLTRAPIFKEIVKKVIAENLRQRMLREAIGKDSEEMCGTAEPDISDTNQPQPSMKDMAGDNENNNASSASSHGDSPRSDKDENEVSNDDDNDGVGHSDADNMTALVAGYELKIDYLEEELKKKKIVYEQKLGSLIDRISSVENRIEKKKKTPTRELTSEVDVLRKALSEQLSLVNGQIDQINGKMQTLNQRRDHLFENADIEVENIKEATSENKLSDVNENLVENTLERVDRNARVLTGMKCEVAGMNNDIDGRIREILSVVTEQRRKYKSKFLEVETEAARVKIMVNATKGLLENVQNSLEEIEGGKRNNLIFHGVVSEHPETQIRCRFHETNNLISTSLISVLNRGCLLF